MKINFKTIGVSIVAGVVSGLILKKIESKNKEFIVTKKMTGVF